LEDIQASVRAKSRARVYDFSNPSLVGIRWREVATGVTEDSYIVRAGRYRLVLLYTKTDPAEVKSRKVDLCNTISREFVIEQDSTVHTTE